MTETQTRPAAVLKTTDVAFPGVLRMNTQLMGYDRPWSEYSIRTPKHDPDYVWDQELLMTLVVFYLGGDTSCKLIGHTGTGKTSGVVEFHAALNLPLFTVIANPRMEAYHLVGRLVPTGGGMKWVDGPLMCAARYGMSILIDEYNLLDCGEAAGLNSFLEGRSYTIPDTGETVVPQPGFRVYATINPKTVGYRGRNDQDLSNDDRFALNVLVDYPKPDVEEKFVVDFLTTRLRQKVDEASNIAKIAVKAANMIRQSFAGESDEANALPFTMSRRGVLNWAKWTVLCKNIPRPDTAELFHALDLTLGNRQERMYRQALKKLVELATGEMADKGV